MEEIAEETAKDNDFDFNMNDANGDLDMKNVFQKLFKNPGKLINLVKNIGKKLDDKFKSGEIKESELMQEASDLLKKMKNMPGMNNISEMLNKMGMGSMGGMGSGKPNFGAMQSQLDKNIKLAKMKERMQTKLAQQQQQQEQQPPQDEKPLRSDINKKKKKKNKKYKSS